ncbi:hypothetical protein, partial [Thermus scotoductus]|uniref:hypothetical protein n=1 Tax=Thermus scotoductus TaxID=37636 RepID=UPI001000C280
STPRWRLEGTFGARPRRIGGRLYTPVELVQELRAFVNFYFEERFRRTERQAPLVELVFDDLDRGLHWAVGWIWTTWARWMPRSICLL